MQSKTLIFKICHNQWFELFSRWALGTIFIYAGYGKIMSPAAFAKIVFGYDLFPISLINPIAILLPSIEVTAGVFLLLGVFPRSAVLIINVLLILFMLVISINLIRGHEFDCGCFLKGDVNYVTSPEKWLFRDVGLLFIGGMVFFYKGVRKMCFLNKA